MEALKDFYTVLEVARLLDMKCDTLRVLIRKEKVKAVKVNNSYLISKEEVERLKENQSA